ncbi:hypothetical protein [Synechocystis sp. PCC 7509]|uniref:hypothetical protein n=1 Tax=Synechocystis sp. PCC 7509 TaxID=927677 RepID=UPI0002AC725F|nr:hypothetical protein [Synechocystis sp. PCC 7509]
MMHEPTNPPMSIAELEILSLLIESGDEIYPWDTTTLAAEAYFSEAEQQLAISNELEQELIAKAPNFLSQLDGLWLANTPKQDLQTKLSAQFAAHVPQKWLEAISRQASQVINNQKSLGAQLVQCVKELVPNCLEEDLLVLARPYAYAMRSNPSNGTMPLEITPEQWANLSEIQQAKFSLAIARYALEQLQAQENP